MFSSLSTIKNLKPSSPRLSNSRKFFFFFFGGGGGGVNIHKIPPILKHAWFIVFISIKNCKWIFSISFSHYFVKSYISCY